jgi:hypothetical protein
LLAVAAATAAIAPPVAAQRFEAGGRVLLAHTRAAPVPGGGTLTELKLVQPVATLYWELWGGRAALQGTLNLEGATMPGGELAPGAFGEGWNDRRHPHTYAHELMVVLTDAFRAPAGLNWSLAVGKGFVPFGTDDPMHRPPLRYPVNHHWSQILERWVTALGLASGPLVLEGALFNGDEPEYPAQWPRFRGRFADSWSVRARYRPFAGAEIGLSRARVGSPEHRPGAGPDHFKWNASASLARKAPHGRIAALAEWARNSELGGLFAFESGLLEAEWAGRRSRAYVRLERTERPEELRTTDLFRSQRPHLEDAIIGITRWSLLTLGYGHRRSVGRGFSAAPVMEVTYARVRSVGGGLFVPELVYGRNDGWTVAVGLRLAGGSGIGRMGRYGVGASGNAVWEEHSH